MKNIIIAIGLLVSTSIQAQSVTDEIFKNLHEGALLVRLTTKLNTINAVKDNNPALAQKIIREQQKQNQEIVDAFSNSFKYCPVYYFYAESSKKVRNREFAGVLMDKSLNPLQIVPVLENNYLVASFSYTKVDTTKYYTGTYMKQGGENGVEYTDQYGNSSMSTGVDALVLFSPELIALQSPYPHYARTYERLPFKRTKAKTVSRLQSKIEKYIKQNKK